MLVTIIISSGTSEIKKIGYHDLVRYKFRKSGIRATLFGQLKVDKLILRILNQCIIVFEKQF